MKQNIKTWNYINICYHSRKKIIELVSITSLCLYQKAEKFLKIHYISKLMCFFIPHKFVISKVYAFAITISEKCYSIHAIEKEQIYIG